MSTTATDDERLPITPEAFAEVRDIASTILVEALERLCAAIPDAINSHYDEESAFELWDVLNAYELVNYDQIEEILKLYWVEENAPEPALVVGDDPPEAFDMLVEQLIEEARL